MNWNRPYWELFGEAHDVAKCRECGRESNLDTWPEGEGVCSDCGSHGGITCPHCGEFYDYVMNDKVELRPQVDEVKL